MHHFRFRRYALTIGTLRCRIAVLLRVAICVRTVCIGGARDLSRIGRAVEEIEVEGADAVDGDVTREGLAETGEAHVRTVRTGVVLIGNVMVFPCYMTGVRLIGADKAILYGFSEPVSAAIIGSAFLGSPFTLWDGLGFVLVFAMMVLTSISAKAESAENAK